MASGLRRALLTAVALCAVCPAGSPAAIHTRDAVATRAYLRASETSALAGSAGLKARIAELEARSSQIAGECPGALTYAPRDEAFSRLGEEVVTVAAYASAAPERPALLRTSKEIGHLRWSNSRLTRLVRRRAAEESGAATVALPDVCAEIAAWKASAYVALPQSAGRFLARTEAIESESYVGPSEVPREAFILRLLKPYESPADKRIARRVEHLEDQVGRRVSSAISAVRTKLEKALGSSTV